MGIQGGNHAGYGFREQFLVVNRFDVIRFDQAEHICKLAQFIQWQRRSLLLRHGGKLDRSHDTDDDAQSYQQDVPKFVTHVSPYPVKRIIGTPIVPYFEV